MNPGTFLIVNLELCKKNAFGKYTANSAEGKEWRPF